MSAVASATTPGTQQAQAIQHRKKPRSAILLSAVAWIVGILFILPVLWMVLTSFHSEPDAAKNPPAIFAPLSLEGYKTLKTDQRRRSAGHDLLDQRRPAGWPRGRPAGRPPLPDHPWPS